MSKKNKGRWILTFVSTCSCGQDIHSYLFETKTEAQEAMKSSYKADKQEIEKSKRVSHITRDSYEVYENGRFMENHLVAKIIKVDY